MAHFVDKNQDDHEYVKKIWSKSNEFDLLNSFMVALALMKSECHTAALKYDDIDILWKLLKASLRYIKDSQRSVIAFIISTDAMRERGLDKEGVYAGLKDGLNSHRLEFEDLLSSKI